MGNESSSYVDSEFRKAGILKDVIPIAPTELLYVAYKLDNYFCELKMGELVYPATCCLPPRVHWEFSRKELYTLCLINPDYPTRKNRSEGQKLHWLVINIPENEIADGESLVPYLGCRPQKNTGLHRYIFLVYRQNGRIVASDPEFYDRRKRSVGFNICNFAIKYKLGNPIAGIYYWSKYNADENDFD